MNSLKPHKVGYSYMNKQKLIIYGIGAMARTYAMHLEQIFDIEAYTVTKDLISDSDFNDKPLVPFEDVEKYFSPQHYQFIVAVGYIEFNKLRASIAAQAQLKGFKLAQYLGSPLLNHPSLQFGSNTVVLDQSSIHSHSIIGDNVFITSCVQIGHDCKIGNNVWINAGVTLGGGVVVGDNTFIGMNATIAHDVTIGSKCFIGASTLVTSSIENERVVIAPAGQELSMNSETFLKFSKM